MSEEVKTKRCSKCQEEKPLGMFHRDKSAQDGRYSQCRLCKNAAVRIYYKTDKGQAIQRAYRLSEGRRISRRKYQQSQKGKEAVRRYWQSEKGRATRRRVQQSEKGRACQCRYRLTEKGRATYKKHSMRSDKRARILLVDHYVKGVIKLKYNIPRIDTTAQMIQCEREWIKLSRAYRQKKKEIA